MTELRSVSIPASRAGLGGRQGQGTRGETLSRTGNPQAHSSVAHAGTGPHDEHQLGTNL